MRNKKSIIALMIFAFLWSAVQPLFASYAAAGGEDFFGGGRVLICTSKGFEWVSVSDLGEGGTAQEERHLKCAMCALNDEYAVGGLLASYSIDTGYAWQYAGESVFPDVLLWLPDPPYIHLPSRAPPVMS